MNMDAYWLDGGSSNFGGGRFVASFMLGPGELLPAEHQFEYVCLPPLLLLVDAYLLALRAGTAHKCS